MEFEQLHQHWDAWGRTDPLFAILTNDADKRGGGWDLDAFFATGRTKIAEELARVATLPGAPRGGRVLDFGCGVGRLTQAFCDHFAECHGVDIAPSMVAQARQYNRFGDRCQYHANVAGNLRLFPDGHFDLVYTNAVLQHMRPDYALGYVREFVRVLKPGGLASFELPSHRAVAELLPAGSFRAEIQALDPPATLRAGVPARIRVRVRNTSTETWPSYGRDAHGPDARNFLALGNHWRSVARPDEVVVDDGRALLAEVLAPGQACELTLEVRPPARPGSYRLELDLVQEGRTWFADRGSPITTLSVRVAPPRGRLHHLAHGLRGRLGRRAASGPLPVDEPVMEMHCTPKADVLAVLDASGARVLAIDPEHNAYHGFRYYVTR